RDVDALPDRRVRCAAAARHRAAALPRRRHADARVGAAHALQRAAARRPGPDVGDLGGPRSACDLSGPEAPMTNEPSQDGPEPNVAEDAPATAAPVGAGRRKITEKPEGLAPKIARVSALALVLAG